MPVVCLFFIWRVKTEAFWLPTGCINYIIFKITFFNFIPLISPRQIDCAKKKKKKKKKNTEKLDQNVIARNDRVHRQIIVQTIQPLQHTVSDQSDNGIILLKIQHLTTLLGSSLIDEAASLYASETEFKISTGQAILFNSLLSSNV